MTDSVNRPGAAEVQGGCTEFLEAGSSDHDEEEDTDMEGIYTTVLEDRQAPISKTVLQTPIDKDMIETREHADTTSTLPVIGGISIEG
jgi:hypothetical protein